MAGSGFSTLVVLVVIVTTIWVGIDASRRDWSKRSIGTSGWVVLTLLLWIVFFPLYLSKRGGAPLKNASSPAAAPVELVGLETLYRECEHCKQPVPRDASICPHCDQRSTPWRFHEGRWWHREDEQDTWAWLDERTGEWHEIQQAPPSKGRQKT